MAADEVVARARGCVGARFRLHGRSMAGGLDCVGVAAVAFAVAGVPAGYAMRGGRVAAVAAVIDGLGLVRGEDGVRAGDLLLLEAGPHQLHLAIRTGAGFVHADALLRRVTEVPGAPRWPLLGWWRRAPTPVVMLNSFQHPARPGRSVAAEAGS